MQIAKEAVLEYLDRMRELERMKWRYRAEPRSETPGELLRQGDSLRRHVQSLQPGWPTEAQRDQDLQTHIRVSEMLRSVQSKPGR